MKKYAVTLTGHYEKTISVYADTTEQAAEKVKIKNKETIQFRMNEPEESIEAKIEDVDKEDGKEKDTPDEEEAECMNHEDCSGCPYLCPACGECLCEYED